jgi:transmembrane E3 ubiquitin-protein ligase
MKFEEEEWGSVAGTLSGKWVRFTGGGGNDSFPGFPPLLSETTGGPLNLTKITPGVHWAFSDPEDWTMNVTGNEGTVMLRVDEKASLEIEIEQEPETVELSELGELREIGISRQMALVREVAATMTIQDSESSNNDDGWEMRVYGVHWPRIGVLLMTTTSEKFAGIFGLPHLSGAKDYFRTSQRLLTATIGKTLEGMEKSGSFGASNPWTATPGVEADATKPVPHCEYVVYLQMHPRENTFVEGVPNGLETSMIKGKCSWGDSTPRIQELQMSLLIFSPDCGFILKSKGSVDYV